MKQKMVILLSGGIESLVTAALAAEVGGQRHALYVDYGHLASAPEASAARAIAREYGMHLEVVELKLPFLERHSFFEEGGVIISNEHLDETFRVVQSTADRAHVIPYRNLAFLSLATMFAGSIGAAEVWCGFDDRPNATRTKDKSAEFVLAYEGAVAEATDDDRSAPRVVTPLQGNSKVDTIRRGQSLGVDWSLSWSCYNGFSLPCGLCAQCQTRVASMSELGLPREAVCTREFVLEQATS